MGLFSWFKESDEEFEERRRAERLLEKEKYKEDTEKIFKEVLARLPNYVPDYVKDSFRKLDDNYFGIRDPHIVDEDYELSVYNRLLLITRGRWSTVGYNCNLEYHIADVYLRVEEIVQRSPADSQQAYEQFLEYKKAKELREIDPIGYTIYARRQELELLKQEQADCI